jgi:hypothetical protein
MVVMRSSEAVADQAEIAAVRSRRKEHSLTAEAMVGLRAEDDMDQGHVLMVAASQQRSSAGAG